MVMDKWRSYLLYRKEVECRNGRCRYSAILTWERGKSRAYGLCTKCGESWSEDPPTDRELAEDLIR